MTKQETKDGMARSFNSQGQRSRSPNQDLI